MAHGGFFLGPAVLTALNVIIHNKTDIQPSGPRGELKLVSCSVFGQWQAEPSTAPVEWPSSPWQRIHIDFARPFLGCMFLIVVDAHSRCLEIEKMDTTTSTKTRCSSREMESNI